MPLALDAQLNSGREPRLSQPTYWWLQVVGRVKSGVTAAQVQANLENVFRNTARAGFDSYLATLSEAARSTSDNRKDDGPYPARRSGSGVYYVNTTTCAP